VTRAPRLRLPSRDDRAVTAEEFVGFVLAREQKLSRGALANVTKLAEITVGLSV
jgi:hypothetical protein